MIDKRSGAERRRFFRIEDRLQLALRRRPDAEPSRGGLRATEFLSDIDRRIGSIITAARVQAPAVGELAELLNRKMNYVIEALELRDELIERASLSEEEVSISACGIGLRSVERFEPGETLELELVLPPDGAHLRIPARVVRCTGTAGGRHLLQLDFAEITPDDQEQLIQFIVRRQGLYLQRLREQREARPSRMVS